MSFTIRQAEPRDAQNIGRLAQEFIDYLRSIGDTDELRFDAKAFLRDGFGANPAFSGIVAESGDEILGYLLYHPGYDADYAIRTLHVIDLYVRERWRGRGIGQALMKRAGEICRSFGGKQLFWAVYEPNKAAINFYERLGARFTRDLLFMRLDV